MPEVHPSSVRNHASTPQPAATPRRPRHRPFGLALLGMPSPALPGTTTTDSEMLFWVGVFYRVHQRRKWLIPIQLKTLDCPIEKPDGSPVLGGDGQPARMRCVREVARREARGQVTWTVIEYSTSVPGLRFCPYPSLDDAMRHFDAAPEPVRLP